MTAPAEPLALERRQRRVAKRGFRLRRYGGRLLALALSALAVLILVAVIDGTGPLDLPAHLLNRSTEPLGFVAGGVIAAWLGAWVVLAGVWLLGVILRGAGVLSAVARVTLDEALRTRVVTFAAGLLIVILAALPLMLTGDQPLRYQLQSYLAYSVFAATALLSVLVCLYGCYTAASDLEEQRAHELFTKPVARGTYLLGKWAGVALLSVVLVAAAGLMIGYVATVVIGGPSGVERRAADPYDALAITDQVLVARGAAAPQPPAAFEELATARLDAMQRTDPDAYQSFVQNAGGARAALAEAAARARAAWLRVPPGEARPYRFAGLGPAKAAAGAGGVASVQLRYRPKLPRFDRGAVIDLAVQLEGAAPAVLPAAVNQVQIEPISAEFIADDGTLDILLANLAAGSGEEGYAVQFEEGDLQVLYRVGGFWPNLGRGMALLWVRLGFLSMFAVAAGALLSMPVAMTLTLAAAVLATFGAALSELLGRADGPTDIAAVDAAYQVLVSGVYLVTRALSAYGEVGVGTLLADGRWVRGADVLRTGGLVAALWVGLVFLVAWGLLSRREIARVQV